MKPASDVKTPAQYIASLPADRAKTIATVRALAGEGPSWLPVAFSRELDKADFDGVLVS